MIGMMIRIQITIMIQAVDPFHKIHIDGILGMLKAQYERSQQGLFDLLGDARRDLFGISKST